MQATPPSRAGARAERIAAVLRQAFVPSVLRITDDSARHAGHAGHDSAGETHFHVLVVSEAFRGKSRVERSRAVHETLTEEFGSGLHALALTLLTPEQHQLSID